MVNSANGWARPVCLISFLTTSLFLAFPGSLSDLFNDLYSFISLLPTCNNIKLRKRGKLEAAVSLTGWSVVTSLWCQINLKRITQTFPIGLSVQTKLYPLFNAGLDFHFKFKLSCQLT